MVVPFFSGLLRPRDLLGPRAAQAPAAAHLSTVRKALKDLDEDGSGTLSRDEVQKFLREQNLMKYFDFYTGMTRGDLDPKVVETLLDMCDGDGNGQINYTEFADVVMAGAN